MGKKRHSGDRTPSPGDKDKKRFRSKDKDFQGEPTGGQIRGHDRTGVQQSPKPFRCPVCRKEYVLERALRAHLLTKHSQLSSSRPPTHQPGSEKDVDEKGSSHSSVEAIAGESQAEDEGEPFTLKRRLLQAFYDDVAFQNAGSDDRDLLQSVFDSEVGRENVNMPPMSSLNKDASDRDEVGVDVVNSEKSDRVKDPKTFDNNPIGESKYRREFVKLLLSATEACEVLLNRFGLDIDSLMTAMLSMKDAGAKQVIEESNINQDVQMVSENGSGRKENPSQSIVSPSSTTSASDSFAPPHSTTDKKSTNDEEIGSERSPKMKSYGCDTADESGNIGFGKPIFIHETRKEEGQVVVRHLSGESELVPNSDEMEMDDSNAGGPRKLSPVLEEDEGKGAGADQNKELMKEGQDCDDKALRDAVKKKRSVSVLSRLIQRGADWKTLDDHKSSQLHLAAQFGTTQSLKFFLDLGGLDVNGTDEDGDTPLHCVVYQEGNEGVLEKCKLLVEKGADLYAKNRMEATFLHKYICFEPTPTPTEFHAITAYLVGSGHSKIFNVADGSENTPLHLAVRFLEPEERTMHLLHSGDVNFNAVNKGDTILSMAANAIRSSQFLEGLITRFSVDPTKLDSNENSLLHYLGCLYSSETLKFFLELRLESLDVNAKNQNGNTPLHWLLLNSEIDVLEKCRLLVWHGADVDSLNKRKQTPLHCAGTVKDEDVGLEIIKLLIEHGTDPLAQDEDGDTPLHYAVYQECNEYVLKKCKLLIEKGADLYAKNRKEATFLHNYICFEPTPTPTVFHSITTFLVENGDSKIFNVADVDGNTPLHLAVRYFEPEERTLRLLHSNSVDFEAVNKEGDTILSLAARTKRSVPFLQSLVTLFSVDATKVDTKKNSLLHLIATCHTLDTLRLVLDLRMEGVNVNQENRVGNSPLHFLLLNSSSEIDILEKCKLLVSHGADVNSRNKQQQTALHCCAGSVKDEDVAVEIIKFLIEHGADPLAKDENDDTFLHIYFLRNNVQPSQLHSLVEFLVGKHHSSIFYVPAGKFRHTALNLLMLTRLVPELKTLLLLKESGNAFNTVDQRGNSALHLAIIGKRSTEFLANLVNQFGSDPKLLNKQKGSILHTAAYFGTADALKFCCQYDLDINGKTTFEQTPLHLAVNPNSNLIDVYEKCRLLVSKGANVNIVNVEGFTPLASVRKFYEGADKDELISLLKQQT